MFHENLIKDKNDDDINNVDDDDLPEDWRHQSRLELRHFLPNLGCCESGLDLPKHLDLEFY